MFSYFPKKPFVQMFVNNCKCVTESTGKFQNLEKKVMPITVSITNR